MSFNSWVSILSLVIEGYSDRPVEVQADDC